MRTERQVSVAASAPVGSGTISATASAGGLSSNATGSDAVTIAHPVGSCAADSECSSGNWCNETAHTCMPTVPNGQTLPVDPSHTGPTLNGQCTSAAGALVCTSGVCDTSNNTCGYRVGDGPCTGGNATVVCDSGACSVSNDCEPSGGCLVDNDCGYQQLCGVSDTCLPGLAFTQLPTASPITFGQSLASSTLTGGMATTPGTFVWTNSYIVPPVGTSTQDVTFLATDSADYPPATFPSRSRSIRRRRTW